MNPENYDPPSFEEVMREKEDTITALRAEVERLTKNEDHLRKTAGGWFDRAHERRLEADELRSQLSARDAEVESLKGEAALLKGLRSMDNAMLEKVIADQRDRINGLLGRLSARDAEVREFDLALIAMTKLHDVVAAERDALDAEVRALRGFAQVMHTEAGVTFTANGDLEEMNTPWIVDVLHANGLCDEYGRPTPLLTGEGEGGGNGS